MAAIRKWKPLHSQLVFDNQWCQVRQDTVELPNGKIIDDYFVHIRPDIALVLAVTTNQEIVFVRQYRHGVGKILLELPGGSFDPQVEDHLTAAARELEEETCYVAQQLTELAILYDNPVKDTNKIHLILASNAQPTGKQQLDITEAVEIELIPIQDVIGKIAAGEICVSGTIAALFLGLDYLAKSSPS